jgi:hypothetical protein
MMREKKTQRSESVSTPSQPAPVNKILVRKISAKCPTYRTNTRGANALVWILAETISQAHHPVASIFEQLNGIRQRQITAIHSVYAVRKV